MNLSNLETKLHGDWRGTNLLRLSWLTPSEFVSPSHLSVVSAVKGKFLSFTYTWSHENKAHEGTILLGYDEKQGVATAAWADSWHMSNKLMFCQGTIDAQGVIDLRGTYEAPPDPDWGWRIIISSPTDHELHLTMYNCPPDGTEDLAVQADFTRAG